MAPATDGLSCEEVAQSAERPEELDRIALVIDFRNLIAHNREIINRVFKGRQPDFPGNLGDVINMDMEKTTSDIDYLAAPVVDIEHRASKKWGLSTTGRT